MDTVVKVYENSSYGFEIQVILLFTAIEQTFF